MSNNSDIISYENFRTGFTFKDVRQMLQNEANMKYENGIYTYITRATVLGRWHEMKQTMYNDYLTMVELDRNNEKSLPDFIYKEY